MKRIITKATSPKPFGLIADWLLGWTRICRIVAGTGHTVWTTLRPGHAWQRLENSTTGVTWMHIFGSDYLVLPLYKTVRGSWCSTECGRLGEIDALSDAHAVCSQLRDEINLDNPSIKSTIEFRQQRVYATEVA